MFYSAIKNFVTLKKAKQTQKTQRSLRKTSVDFALQKNFSVRKKI